MQAQKHEPRCAIAPLLLDTKAVGQFERLAGGQLDDDPCARRQPAPLQTGERGQRQAGTVGRVEEHQIETLRRRAEPRGIGRDQADMGRCADAREVGLGELESLRIVLDQQDRGRAARAGLDADGRRAAEQIQEVGPAQARLTMLQDAEQGFARPIAGRPDGGTLG